MRGNHIDGSRTAGTQPACVQPLTWRFAGAHAEIVIKIVTQGGRAGTVYGELRYIINIRRAGIPQVVHELHIAIRHHPRIRGLQEDRQLLGPTVGWRRSVRSAEGINDVLSRRAWLIRHELLREITEWHSQWWTGWHAGERSVGSRAYADCRGTHLGRWRRQTKVTS